MTLEERIKGIEKDYSDCKQYDEMNGYDYKRRGMLISAKKAPSIIQELQNKNKELEAKLKELNNDK